MLALGWADIVCCWIRKTAPLHTEADAFDFQITPFFQQFLRRYFSLNISCSKRWFDHSLTDLVYGPLGKILCFCQLNHLSVCLLWYFCVFDKLLHEGLSYSSRNIQLRWERSADFKDFKHFCNTISLRTICGWIWSNTASDVKINQLYLMHLHVQWPFSILIPQ